MTPEGSPPRADRSRVALRVLSAAVVAAGFWNLGVYAYALLALCRLSEPHLGWARTIFDDATLALGGDAFYRDPALGPTSMLYTPLFPWLLAGLLRLHYWSGWPLLVNQLAVFGCAAVVAAAYADFRLRSWRFAAGLAWGGLGLSFLRCLSRPLLSEGRADQLAWMFALAALALVPRAHASRAACIASAVATALAFWTKQTTAVAAAVVFGALVASASVRREVGPLALWSSVALVLGPLAAVLLDVASDGWFFGLAFLLPAERHARNATLPVALRALWAPLGAPLVAVAAFSLLAAAIERRALGALAAPTAFLAPGFVAAAYFLSKQGGEQNQAIGLVWAATLALALAFRATAAARPAAALLVVVPIAAFGVHRPSALLEPAAPYRSERPAVAEARARLVAENASVYHPIYPSLAWFGAEHRGYAGVTNLSDVLAMGLSPRYLADRLIRADFDYVAAFPSDDLTHSYTSAYGRHEERVYAKLNAIIHRRYAPRRDLPLGLLARRPGAGELEPWEAPCFGPFEPAPGVVLGARTGGGFWCDSGGGSLAFRPVAAMPLAYSEVHTLEPGQGRALVLELDAAAQAGAFAIGVSRGPRARWLVADESALRLVRAAHVGVLRELVALDPVVVAAGRVPVRIAADGPRASVTFGDPPLQRVVFDTEGAGAPLDFTLGAVANRAVRYDALQVAE